MKATDFFHCAGQLTSINFRSSLSLKGNSNCWMFELLSSLLVISGNGRSPENQFHMLYKFWKVVIETNYFQCLNDKNLLCTWMLLCGKIYEHAGGKGMHRRKSVDLTSSTHASNSSLVPGSSEKDVKCPRRKLIELLP